MHDICGFHNFWALRHWAFKEIYNFVSEATSNIIQQFEK